jgi:ATP phosphoribosyltransferase
MNEPQAIRLGIPKGSLEDATLSIFRRVGVQFTGTSRSLWLHSNDPEIIPVLLRPQEIPVYVENGRLDAGVAGLDWIVERNVKDKVALLADLRYAKQTSCPVRWVLAVPERLPVRSVDELRELCDERGVNGAARFTIATELTEVSNMWLARNGVDASTVFSWGATEAKAGYFADAIIEATETGSSLLANGLRPIADVFRSTTQFFANTSSYHANSWKREKLDGLAHLLAGALRADDMVQLTVVSDGDLGLTDILPPDARVVVADKSGDGSTFRAVVTLSKVSVPHAIPAVISRGATHAWVSALDVYYSAANSREAPPVRLGQC